MIAETRCFRVLGGLGRGSFAPLLAEAVFVDGYTRRVVLHRPAPKSAWPLAGVSSPHVVAEEERVVTAQGTFAVSPWLAGDDFDGLVARGVSPRARVELLAQAVAGLRAAAAAGVAHGALSGATVRVDRSGTVRLLGFRGEGSDDLAELWDLARLTDDGAPAPLVALLADVPASLDAALERIAAVPPLEGRGLADLVAEEQPVAVHAHALSGVELREAAPAPPMPAKVRLAGTAALTLILGLLAGSLFARAPAPAEEVRVPCGDGVVSVRGNALDIATTGCE